MLSIESVSHAQEQDVPRLPVPADLLDNNVAVNWTIGAVVGKALFEVLEVETIVEGNN